MPLTPSQRAGWAGSSIRAYVYEPYRVSVRPYDPPASRTELLRRDVVHYVVRISRDFLHDSRFDHRRLMDTVSRNEPSPLSRFFLNQGCRDWLRRAGIDQIPSFVGVLVDGDLDYLFLETYQAYGQEYDVHDIVYGVDNDVRTMSYALVASFYIQARAANPSAVVDYGLRTPEVSLRTPFPVRPDDTRETVKIPPKPSIITADGSRRVQVASASRQIKIYVQLPERRLKLKS